MNQMIVPPTGLSYVPSQYAAAANQARSVAPLTQLAAAAAVTNGGRNRLLGANTGVAGVNPFGLTGANTANAFGLYGNAGYPAAAAAAAAAAGGLLGLQNRGTGAVPLIPDLPNRQRRVQPRGGHLEVAGMIVGSWGANYGGNGNLTNSLAAGAGRGNVRVPMGHGMFPNQNIQVRKLFSKKSVMFVGLFNILLSFFQTCLFDQMRISGTNKVPNRPVGQGGQWQKKSSGKNQVRGLNSCTFTGIVIGL